MTPDRSAEFADSVIATMISRGIPPEEAETHREGISQAFADLVASGIIEIRGNDVVVLDMESLAAIAGEWIGG